MGQEFEKSRLGAAYGLSTPSDSEKLYGDWAATYDQDFAEASAYTYPAEIAALFAHAGGEGPVLDIGCGTGLVGEALAARPVDGVDISPEMLAKARAKGCYRDLIAADLTKTLAIEDAAYRGLVSAGTFTHGHVGAEALDELVRIAAPGAVMVLGVRDEIYVSMGFEAALARLAAAGAVTAPEIRAVRVYAEGAAHDHAEDRANAVLLRRL